ncbi:MAG TPA: GNAT family N-acetyltransferase [Chloroflexia bacterium]|nr:GNAT family N-acetyltransferase [Chloroflexia bacterium]
MDTDLTNKLVALALASVEGFRSLAFAAGGTCEEVGGTICWYSASHVHLFNGAALLSGSQINPDNLDAIDLYFARKGRPYCLLTLQDLVPSAAMQLAHLGYSEAETLPAMWLSGPPNRWRGSPEELSISRVSTPGELEAFRSVLSRIFFMPRAEVDLVLGDRTLEAGHVHHYVGKLGEVPVATTTLVLDGTLAGIWNVGTLREHGRRGIGTEMMHHALDDAINLGYGKSMLLASAEGVPLYERLGYYTLSMVKTFVPARQR